MSMVHAEKIVTAIQRGIANTRWCDLGDIWTIFRRHPIVADELRKAIEVVASHRDAEPASLREALDGYGELAQGAWAQWRRRSNFDHLPERFAEVLSAVIAFADPVLAGNAAGDIWNPDAAAWASRDRGARRRQPSGPGRCYPPPRAPPLVRSTLGRPIGGCHRAVGSRSPRGMPRRGTVSGWATLRPAHAGTAHAPAGGPSGQAPRRWRPAG